jgi:hypothetical protein
VACGCAGYCSRDGPDGVVGEVPEEECASPTYWIGGLGEESVPEDRPMGRFNPASSCT